MTGPAAASAARTLSLLLTLWLSSAAVWAAPPAEFSYLLTDTDTRLDEVRGRADWRTQSGRPALGYPNQTLWLRLSAPEFADVMLVNGMWVKHYTVFVVGADGSCNSYAGGYGVNVSERIIDHQQSAFPLPGGAGTQVFIRQEPGRYPAMYPIQFYSAAQFNKATIDEHLLYGFFYGLFFIVLLYNAFIALGLRETIHLHFMTYNLGLIGIISAASGYSRYYLWPETAGLQDVASSLSLAVAIIFSAQFTLKLLNVSDNDWHWRRIVVAMQIAVAVACILFLASSSPALGLFFPITLLLMALTILALNLYFVRRGDYRALIYLLANSPLVGSAAFNAAAVLGQFPGHIALVEMSFISAAFTIVVLSIMLTQRFGRLTREADKARIRSRELSAEVRQLQASTSLANEHRELQKSIQQTQKLKSIGQLTGGVAHDFNNILASILGFTELALDKGPNIKQSDRIRYLQEIQTAGQRGADLVKQLLIYSQGGSSQARDINLHHAVQQSVQLLRGSIPTSVRIHAELSDEEIMCHIDPVLLQQMLVNLAMNASEAMNNRGEIWVKLGTRSVDDAVCSSCLTPFSGDFAVIRVEDSGPGLRGNVHDLFNPFHTSKPVGEGSGLGLSVVHGIVHEHHGHVQLSDRAPQGARASIFIPQHRVSESVLSATRRILLVVEDRSVRTYLDELLTSQGYEVTPKSLPHQALEIFVAGPELFDLVIAEYQMPGTTGPEFATEMRHLRPDLPVVLTTSTAENTSESQIKRTGISAVFEKPIKANLLLAKIRGLLSV